MLLYILLLLLGILQFGECTSCSLQNSSLNLILEDQCVTKDELRAVLQAELQSLKSDVAQLKRNTVQSPQSLTSGTLIKNTEAPRTQSNGYQCGGTSGWKQVAYINMTNTSHTCPPGLNLTSYSKRTCGRSNPAGRTCSLTSFRVGFVYQEICGRIKAYQWGISWGLYDYFNGHGSIDKTYLDGLSLTHGCDGERHHIWSFIASIYAGSGYPVSECPCDRNYETNLPSFVGGNYFCESAVRLQSQLRSRSLVSDNPLWDGQNCGENGNTCCQVNNPPWFKTTLRSSTVNDIDLRMCAHRGFGAADIPIEVIELYVK